MNIIVRLLCHIIYINQLLIWANLLEITGTLVYYFIEPLISSGKMRRPIIMKDKFQYHKDNYINWQGF